MPDSKSTAVGRVQQRGPCSASEREPLADETFRMNASANCLACGLINGSSGPKHWFYTMYADNVSNAASAFTDSLWCSRLVWQTDFCNGGATRSVRLARHNLEDAVREDTTDILSAHSRVERYHGSASRTLCK